LKRTPQRFDVNFTAPYQKGFKKGSLTEDQKAALNKRSAYLRARNKRKQYTLPNWVTESITL
jgi:hypothetical protein